MKKGVLLFITSLLAIPGVFALTLPEFWEKIITVGTVGNLLSDANAVVALTRILIGIVIFTVFYAVITTLGKGEGGKGGALGFLNKNQAMVVALVLALISAIFIPPAVLLAAGTGWATAIAFILVGLPVVGLGWLLWYLPGRNSDGTKKEDTRATFFLKAVLCLVLFWILSAMKTHLAGLASGF